MKPFSQLLSSISAFVPGIYLLDYYKNYTTIQSTGVQTAPPRWFGEKFVDKFPEPN